VRDHSFVRSSLPAYHWFIECLARDPQAFYQLTPRQFEELIAGRYEREGWKATLTPRSGDKGIDVIATRPDFGMIRIVDQVKLYKPHLVVDADEVRSLLGVLNEFERAASKCVLTTTSRFARGVQKDFAHLIPTRLWLRDYDFVKQWLLSDRSEE
jgi:restriction system protein